MDEFVYSLLLKGTQGLTLLGTLRYRFTDLTASTRARDIQALMGETIDRPTIELFILPAEGSLSVPLVTGPTPVQIAGIGFGSPAGLLTVLFSSSEDSPNPNRSISMQINPIDATHIGGGLVLRPGGPGMLVFSVLGTQLEFAM